MTLYTWPHRLKTGKSLKEALGAKAPLYKGKSTNIASPPVMKNKTNKRYKYNLTITCLMVSMNNSFDLAYIFFIVYPVVGHLPNFFLKFCELL